MSPTNNNNLQFNNQNGSSSDEGDDLAEEEGMVVAEISPMQTPYNQYQHRAISRPPTS
jgi:hypothetical protein